jgi:hypothetical protein
MDKHRSAFLRSGGGIVVVGWLTRVTLTLAIVGVLLFDVSALLVGRVSVADHADSAAQAAADSWRQQHSYPSALLAAQTSAGGDEVVPDSLVISPDGATTITLHRQVSTLVVQHVPHLDELGSVTGTGTARPPLN